MRRTLSVLLILGLLFGALVLPAEAKKKKKKKKKQQKIERVAEWAYDAPAIGSGAGVCLVPTNSCARFAVGIKEKYVSIEITDAAGLPVYASVGQDLTGDGFSDVSTTICGASEEPIPVEPGYEMTVFPWAVGGPDCPGVATSGTVTVTLSNRP